MKESEQEISLQVINKQGFVYRIKNLFRKMFFRNEKLDIAVEENVNIGNEYNIETKKQFIKNIKIEANEELLGIQRKLEKGNIFIEELTEVQIEDLIKLYSKQIAIKKEKLNNIKNKIINIRNKLAV